MRQYLTVLTILLCSVPVVGQSPDIPKQRTADSPRRVARLFEWNRGVAVASPVLDDMRIYLWFYEWNMFEARSRGQHTKGAYKWPRTVSPDGQLATIKANGATLTAEAVEDGAKLTLEITNQTDHDWPDIAGIIPCFNPGPPPALRNDRLQASRNSEFVNANTWYVGATGLEKLIARQIHFNDRLRAKVDEEAVEDKFVFSSKWPTSPDNATEGLIVRESTNGKWVSGIAWEKFLSSQGHNPWSCMHLSVNVGPLKSGESKTIRGRMYLFPGNRDDCLKRFRSEFAE